MVAMKDVKARRVLAERMEFESEAEWKEWLPAFLDGDESANPEWINQAFSVAAFRNCSYVISGSSFLLKIRKLEREARSRLKASKDSNT